MSKNPGSISSKARESQLSGDTRLGQATEMTTALGEYAATSHKSKGSSAFLLPLLLIVLLLLAFGMGGYAYVRQNEYVEIHNEFVDLQLQTERIAASTSLILTNDPKVWAALEQQIGSLNSSWESLLNKIPSLSLKEPEYAKLKAAFADLEKQKNMIMRTLSMVAGPSVSEKEIQIAQQKAAGSAQLAHALFDALQEIGVGYSLQANQHLHFMYMGLLGIGVLAFLIAIIISKQYLTIRRGRGREMGQLSDLVEDLQAEAERQRNAAQEQVAAARRVNEANQAAILRLMNELQSLAEGDLTQQATVTEDITGAIADSVNYTVEELRTLVAQVQNATNQVSKTTAVVETTSTELLASSDEQLHEIRETGQAIMEVAKRINEVSSHAQQSSVVATQSLGAAEKGLKAVQNVIGGMNTIREQIQDTSKRIKRLVESSQEIGEITDLIADITEQTNVLALNAAIQAASAGEAGRGFSVVAEEVQRLAERSADATRQIASLVKAIQGDMQDAMAAMERSTQGVVEGARLSDETGTAFSEINAVTNKLANLIKQIADQSKNEANSANNVADNIQHIFAVTEQTADGTRSTTQQVRELARVASQLERSVARFKIS